MFGAFFFNKKRFAYSQQYLLQCTQVLANTFGDVAQLVRAPALQAGGPGFESPHLHHQPYTIRAISSAG